MNRNDDYVSFIKDWIRPLQKSLTLETESDFNNILGRKKYFNEYLSESFNDLEKLKLSDEFIEQLKTSIPEIVFIYSENSARNYLNLLKKYNLIDNWMNTNLMCLGEKSSSILNEIKWKKIFLFNPGEEEYLLYKI